MQQGKNAVLFNASSRDWFRTTIGVRQGCFLSPTLFNIFLGIMIDKLKDHKNSDSIGCQIFLKLRFANDFVFNAEEEEEADGIVTSMDTISTWYKMEIGPVKTNIMTTLTGFKERTI